MIMHANSKVLRVSTNGAFHYTYTYTYNFVSILSSLAYQYSLVVLISEIKIKW